ncbi:MAG: TIM44-like domain-containing protein [Oscillospiraceae bacterium]|nr:TIM44-like domain-containing protein [Oscillospiraceae bacterium]
MKKKIALLIAAIIIMLSSTVAFADFGDFAGGSDWGYSDFGGGYDSDFGGNYDYYGSGYGVDYYYSDNSDQKIGFFEIIITLVIILLIVFAVVGRNSIGKNVSPGKESMNIPSSERTPMINDISGLKQRDPGFSESKFLGEVSNLYIRTQDAWTAKDLSSVRPHFTEELYARFERQVRGYIDRGQTNHVERVSVLNAKIVGCTCDSKNDIITVEILSRITDYITDDKSGNIIRGDRNRELFMTYQWTFIRTFGKLSEEEKFVDEKHCPNCGAPIDLNRSAVCEYCGSVCTSSDYNWVVSDIKGIGQRTV